jgi:uncharacterized protein (DUF3084 family)
MFLWVIIEPCIAVLAVIFVITQLILPAIMDRPIFPVFRWNNRKLKHAEGELRNIRVEKDVNKLESEVRNQRKQLKAEKREMNG